MLVENSSNAPTPRDPKANDAPVASTAAVVLSPEAYDALADRAELAESLAQLDRSADDIKAGRTTAAKQAFKKLADELGLKFDR